MSFQAVEVSCLRFTRSAAIASASSAAARPTEILPRSFDEVCPALPLDIILPGQAINANVYIRLLNDSIRSAAATGGANVLDVSSLGDLLTANGDNYFNCNHLSAVGNEIVAEFFADELLAASNER